MENYFESEEFVSSLSALQVLFDNNEVNNKDAIGYITGVSLKYYMLFNGMNIFSIERMNEFVKNIVNYIVVNNIKNFHSKELLKYVNYEYINEILNVLNIDKEKMTPNAKKELGKLIAVSLERFDYKFHGFNGYFLNSIKENGINPGVKDEQDNIKQINDIYEKYGINMGLGWSKFDDGKVSYSKDPMVSYDYAQRSPEWFSQFTGGSVHHNQNRTAFEDNDFEGARYNVLKLMADHNFSHEDMQTVMDFFVRNWKKYANQKPIIALVEDKRPKEILDGLIAVHKECGIIDDFDMLLPTVFYSGAVDCKSDKKIDTTNAKFIELPRHIELLKKIQLYSEQTKRSK